MSYRGCPVIQNPKKKKMDQGFKSKSSQPGEGLEVYIFYLR